MNEEELKREGEKIRKQFETEEKYFKEFEDFLNKGNYVDAYKVFHKCPEIIDYMTLPLMMDAYASFTRFLNEEQGELFYSALKKGFEGVRTAPKIEGLICLTFDTKEEDGDLEKGIKRFLRKREEGRDRQFGKDR